MNTRYNLTSPGARIVNKVSQRSLTGIKSVRYLQWNKVIDEVPDLSKDTDDLCLLTNIKIKIGNYPKILK